MKTGIIFNIQKFCLHDGDGIRTCIFLKGCPLRCIWCHNPESIDKKPGISFDKTKCSLCGCCIAVCPNRNTENGIMNIDRTACTVCGKCTEICINDANSIVGYKETAYGIFDEIIKDKIFYDTSGGGVTVTGGEPSYQPEFTLEILRLVKNAGISAAIETCGIGPTDFYKEAADLGVTFLYDIKCIDSEQHRRLTGADNTHIMSNLQYLMARNADIIIRMPLIPDCNDTDENIAALADFLNKNKGSYRYAEIMPYHSMGTAKSEKLGQTPAYIHKNADENDKSRWLSLFAAHGADVKISE